MIPGKPIIDVFAICYNEELILPYFIKHYQGINAKITVYDNGSTDNSIDILKSAGCEIIPYDTAGQIRDDIYAEIKNNCWKKSRADWVIVCDMDEFLVVDFNPQKYTIINSRGYDMVGLPGTNLGVRNTWYDKHLMFRPDAINEINYSVGGHRCKPTGKVVGSKEFATLLHHKYISEEYTLNRFNMYEKRLSDINKHYGWGKEYQGAKNDEIRAKYDQLRANSVVVF